MKAKISMITLGVTDIARSMKFYRDGLGFQTHNYRDGDEMIMFAMEASWLGLFPKDKLADDAEVANDGRGFRGFTLAHNVKSRADVDSTIAAAVRAGASVIKPPKDTSWGGYSGYFADPDGFLWEVAYNPFTDLT